MIRTDSFGNAFEDGSGTYDAAGNYTPGEARYTDEEKAQQAQLAQVNAIGGWPQWNAWNATAMQGGPFAQFARPGMDAAQLRQAVANAAFGGNLAAADAAAMQDYSTRGRAAATAAGVTNSAGWNGFDNLMAGSNTNNSLGLIRLATMAAGAAGGAGLLGGAEAAGGAGALADGSLSGEALGSGLQGSFGLPAGGAAIPDATWGVNPVGDNFTYDPTGLGPGEFQTGSTWNPSVPSDGTLSGEQFGNPTPGVSKAPGFTLPNGAGTAISRILSGNGTASDYAEVAGKALPGVLGAVASNNQATALQKIADQARNDRAPALAKFNSTIAGGPEGFAAGEGAGSLKAILNGLSVGGNPYGSGDALLKGTAQNYDAYSRAVGNYGNLALAGQAPQIAAQTNAVNAGANTYNSVGAAAGDVFNPKSSLADLLTQFGKSSLAGYSFA